LTKPFKFDVREPEAHESESHIKISRIWGQAVDDLPNSVRKIFHVRMPVRYGIDDKRG
jgi:hypothetical protein